MKNHKIPTEFISIQKSLGLDIREENRVYHLNIDSQQGYGNVACISLEKSLKAIDINFLVKIHTIIELEFTNDNLLLFIYGSSGSCSYQFEGHEKVKLENLRSIIIRPDSTKNNKLIFEGECHNKLHVIIIDQEKYFKKYLNGYYHTDYKIESILQSLNTIKFYHQSSFNFNIIEQIRLLQKERKSHSITEFVSMLGIYQLFMAYHIEQFYYESNNSGSHTTLTKSEINIINDLSNYIISLPELQHTICDLCIKAGMSPAKLQTGFKHLHGKTVLNYIRYVRIQKAESLLLNSDLNISEIVYSIGFTSRSYFCKIFRANYNCSPKEYRRSVIKTLLKTVA